MINYTPSKQLKIEEFKTPFKLKLDSSNRWVKLSAIVPWDELACIYYKGLQSKKGRKALDARIAIGSMIIKHKLNLSDRETVATVQENPYMQYFLGLDEFCEAPLFDPSLFVGLRKRMGEQMFDRFNELIIEKAVNKKVPEKVGYTNISGQEDNVYAQTDNLEEEVATNKPFRKLQMDATVSDIYIKYPTDLDLLNTSREWSEKIIDGLSF